MTREDVDDSDEGMEIDEIDDDGSGRDEQLLKLQRYATMDKDITGQAIGRVLVEIFRTAVNNGTKLNVDEVMQPVQQITQNSDIQVRLDLVEQLVQVAKICQEAPHLFGDVLHDHLLGIIIKCLQDSDNQVRMMARAAILVLVQNGHLDNATIEAKVCPVIELLLSTSGDCLNSGIALMSKMAPLIGKELTEKIFLDRYIALCKDEQFCVRKVCVSHFVELCAAVGRKALFRKLFPVFVDLCCDRVWGIRKACVDIMIPLSCCMTLQYRRLLLAELLATHLNDESKWVRTSAFQILGPFISTFAKQFTKVTYNQHGEPTIVFTSQQDTRFSMRYPYEGIFPTKGAVLSHTLDAEDHNPKENFHSSLIIQKPIFELEENEEDSREDHTCMIGIYKSRIQKNLSRNEKLKETTDESEEKYNPFLYHYIAPELPPDDELVEAAKRSSAQNKVERSLDNELSEDKYQMIVPQHLIDSFLSMAEPELFLDMSSDIPHHCAFSFPAVVLTLGREYWPYLKQAYQSLASANQWKVRRTLASSIHEIATILGEELTVSDLLPIYDGFIKDLDEVRIGVLKHLATFLKILKPADRCQYLPRLKEFLTTDNEWNWRFREELATQLLEVVNLFVPSDVERQIVPLSFELLGDKVAAVRHVALSLVTQIAAHLSNNDRLVTALFEGLRYSLGVYAKKWIRRQTFAFVCAHLISSNAISGDRFSQEMLPDLLELSTDKVPNVRLAVARTLSRNVIPMGHWLGVEQAEEVERRLREMRSDPDRDVRILACADESSVMEILSPTKTEQSRNIMF
ncbi:serine/threonine-protein phosphatase 4 regulatory subunit 1 isoform X2 [Calliopsis andreniformis]|uniref:serine/threonine-protein phosphatase 4 regulatory subunit 1 isoform X2 n=1 Tax=Calliopsis andreniformis TaxID=337506 RepID=UPI003FCC48BF